MSSTEISAGYGQLCHIYAGTSSDYVRNGTTDLYAALDVANGAVTHQFTERHRAIEFLDFLKLVARTYRRKELHLVVDNSSSHETKEVYCWLQKHPRFHLYFTPTSSSWMNQVETWFSLLNSRAIRRGAFNNVHSVRDAIERFLNAWNDAAHPFKWVKTADDIMANAKRKDSSDTWFRVSARNRNRSGALPCGTSDALSSRKLPRLGLRRLEGEPSSPGTVTGTLRPPSWSPGSGQSNYF